MRGLTVGQPPDACDPGAYDLSVPGEAKGCGKASSAGYPADGRPSGAGAGDRQTSPRRTPRVDFDPATHIYRVGGEVKPSVTQILGAVGARVTKKLEGTEEERTFWRSFFDYSFLPRAQAEEAKTRGGWVADLIAYELKKHVNGRWNALTEKLSPRQRERLSAFECYPGILGEMWLPYYDCWERWFYGRRDLKTIYAEKPLYDPDADCCGSPDWFGLMAGSPAVIDWKTGIVSPDTAYQTAEYKAMLENQSASSEKRAALRRYIRRYALELHDDGSDARLISFPICDDTNDRGVFLACRRIYQVQVEGIR